MRNRASPLTTFSMAQRARQRGTIPAQRLILEALNPVGMSTALPARGFNIPPSTRFKNCTITNLSPHTASFTRIILRLSQKRTRGTTRRGNVQAPPKSSTAPRAVAQRAVAQARKTTKMTRERRKNRKNLMRRRRTGKTGKMTSSSLPHSRRRVR
jgi:hypothetical protein